jgi:hypothetical protein
MRYALIAAALSTLIGSAQAEILAGGPIYGGPAQVAAICYVYNTGSTALALGTPHIRDQAGMVLLLDINNCSATLSGHDGCGWATRISDKVANECDIGVGPSKANARGALEIRTGSQGILKSIELR